MRVMQLRRWMAVVAPTFLLACGGAYQQSSGTSAARAASGEPEMLTGTVYVTGTEPMVLVGLRIEGQASVNLVGELSGELRRLSGATVEVQGTRRSSAPMDEFDATGYRIVDVDGQEPMVGTVGERSGTLLMYMGPDTLRLSNAPQGLRRPGAKVWVTGRHTASGYFVQSFGVIRDP